MDDLGGSLGDGGGQEQVPIVAMPLILIVCVGDSSADSRHFRQIPCGTELVLLCLTFLRTGGATETTKGGNHLHATTTW